MSGVCADCAKPLCKKNVTGFCRGCSGKRTGPLLRKHSDKFCRVCSKPITRYGSSGLCRAHFVTERLQSPEVQEKRTAGIRRQSARDIDKRRVQLRTNQRKALREKPSYRDHLRERAREIQPLGVAASIKPESLARRGRAISAANAQRRASQGKRPMTFEEQLLAVSEGRARVVEKWRPPSIEPDFTLGGVASGW